MFQLPSCRGGNNYKKKRCLRWPPAFNIITHQQYIRVMSYEWYMTKFKNTVILHHPNSNRGISNFINHTRGWQIVAIPYTTNDSYPTIISQLAQYILITVGFISPLAHVCWILPVYPIILTKFKIPLLNYISISQTYPRIVASVVSYTRWYPSPSAKTLSYG